jgi:hypothetical protein
MKPTRCTANSASLIDHILTNDSNSSSETVILTHYLSDHFPIFYFVKDCVRDDSEKFVKYRDFSDLNFAIFSIALNSHNWDFLDTMDVQSSYDSFSDMFFTLYNLYFPLIMKKIKRNVHKINPWMTNGLLISRRTKSKLFKLSLSHPTVENIDNFKNFRNLYATLIRLSKNFIIRMSLLSINLILKKRGNY